MADLARALEANSNAPCYQVEVTTVSARKTYRVRLSDGNGRFIGRYTLTLADDGMVWIYTAEKSIGLYKLSRFDNELCPNSIRQFFLKGNNGDH